MSDERDTLPPEGPLQVYPSELRVIIRQELGPVLHQIHESLRKMEANSSIAANQAKQASSAMASLNQRLDQLEESFAKHIGNGA